MTGLQIALLVLYILGGIAVGVGAWIHTFGDHDGDPALASMGLLICIVFGASWPLWAAVSPLGFLLYGAGKLIVRSGGRR